MKKALYFSDTKSFRRYIDIYGISDEKPYIVEGDNVLTVEVYNSCYKYPSTTLKNLYRELQAYRHKLLDANGTHSTVVKNFDVLLKTIQGILMDSHEGTADINSLEFNYRVTRHSNGTHDITLMCWDFELPTEPTDELTDELTDEPTDEPTDELTDEPTDELTDEPTDELTDEPTETEAESKQEEKADIDSKKFVPIDNYSYTNMLLSTIQTRVIYRNKTMVLYGYSVTFYHPEVPQLSGKFLDYLDIQSICSCIIPKANIELVFDTQKDACYNSVGVMFDNHIIGVIDYNLGVYINPTYKYDEILAIAQAKEYIIKKYIEYRKYIQD